MTDSQRHFVACMFRGVRQEYDMTPGHLAQVLRIPKARIIQIEECQTDVTYQEITSLRKWCACTQSEMEHFYVPIGASLLHQEKERDQ
jgi:DNA-binding XRE family transcriptional regulator